MRLKVFDYQRFQLFCTQVEMRFNLGEQDDFYPLGAEGVLPRE